MAVGGEEMWITLMSSGLEVTPSRFWRRDRWEVREGRVRRTLGLWLEWQDATVEARDSGGAIWWWGRRVMSSVLEMLRLRCRWDIQFIFKTHESTLAIPVPDLCRAENVNHLERDEINRATLKIILSDSICLEIRSSRKTMDMLFLISSVWNSSVAKSVNLPSVCVQANMSVSTRKQWFLMVNYRWLFWLKLLSTNLLKDS